LFTFSDLYSVCLSVFSCTVLFVSISRVIGCENRHRNDLYIVSSGALYSTPTNLTLTVTQTVSPFSQFAIRGWKYKNTHDVDRKIRKSLIFCVLNADSRRYADAFIS